MRTGGQLPSGGLTTDMLGNAMVCTTTGVVSVCGREPLPRSASSQPMPSNQISGQSPPVQYLAGFAQLARNLEKQQQAGPV